MVWSPLAKAGIRRLLFIVGDYFFDDCFYIEPKGSHGCPDQSALGVVFDMRMLLSSKLLLVRAKETRVLNALVEMVGILQSKRLRPSHAAKVFGRPVFPEHHAGWASWHSRARSH